MSAIIIRFQFSEFKATEFIDLLKQRYGGGVNYIAEGTLLIDTFDSAEEVYEVLATLFSYDDKLFVAEVHNFKSLHNISRSRPAMRKVAI